LFLFSSCSAAENGNENAELCCDVTVEQLIEGYNKMYGDVLVREDLTVQQRKEAEAEFSRKMEDPCRSYTDELQKAGIECKANL